MNALRVDPNSGSEEVRDSGTEEVRVHCGTAPVTYTYILSLVLSFLSEG